MAAHGVLLTTMYTDDYIIIGSRPFVASEGAAFGADATASVGLGAIKVEKTLQGQRVDTIGYTNDTSVNHTIALSATIFLKMMCAMFIVVPPHVRPGDIVDVRAMQSLASRAIRCADIVHLMAPFSRGFSACLRGVALGTETVRLSGRAYEDLCMWRLVLQLGFHDARWTVIPIGIPLLHRHQPGEDAVQRAHRQAAAADAVVFGDACMQHGNGMGFYVPGAGWNSLDAPDLLRHVAYDGTVIDADINLIEFVASLVGLCAALAWLFAKGGSANQHRHIHIWTDNTSCMSWMLRHRAHHPLHLFLLQVLTFIKVTFNVTVTVGHIPGVVNIYADAASRKFNLDNGSGPRLQGEMESLPRLPWPTALMRDISLAATQPLPDTSSQAHAALTALDGVHGWIVQLRTSSTHC